MYAHHLAVAVVVSAFLSNEGWFGLSRTCDEAIKSAGFRRRFHLGSVV
jgi:hypothetical protein